MEYSDEQASQIALIENLNRQDLNPIEEAMGISRVVEEFSYTHEEMAAILGKPRSQISNLLRLLKLDSRIQDFLRVGELSEAHGKILAGLPIEKQYNFATQCIAKKWPSRKLDDMVKSLWVINREKTKIKKDINVEHLEREMSDHFGHPIEVVFTKDNSGSLNIRFVNLDDLQNILEKMGYHST